MAKKSAYATASLKKKLLIYLVVGVVLYGLFYYFLVMPKGDAAFQSKTELNLQGY